MPSVKVHFESTFYGRPQLLCGVYVMEPDFAKLTNDAAKVTCRRCLYAIAIRLMAGHLDPTQWFPGQLLNLDNTYI